MQMNELDDLNDSPCDLKDHSPNYRQSCLDHALIHAINPPSSRSQGTGVLAIQWAEDIDLTKVVLDTLSHGSFSLIINNTRVVSNQTNQSGGAAA